MDEYAQCALEVKEALKEKILFTDDSRISQDTGILEFPTSPLVTPEKGIQKYFGEISLGT